MRLRPVERSTLVDRAASVLRRMVLRGDLGRDGRLEPIRALADDLGVSVGVIREAIARLRGEGLVEARQGVGVFAVRGLARARGIRAARLGDVRREAAELREALDPAAARRAARDGAAGGPGIEAMHSALMERRIAAMGRDPTGFTRADAAFHLAVAKASGSGIAVGLHRMAASMLQRDLAARASEHARSVELGELHAALFEAIAQGKERRAERAARAIALIESRPP